MSTDDMVFSPEQVDQLARAGELIASMEPTLPEPQAIPVPVRRRARNFHITQEIGERKVDAVVKACAMAEAIAPTGMNAKATTYLTHKDNYHAQKRDF